MSSLDNQMKLSHCHVDVTANAVGADLDTVKHIRCNLLRKRIYRRCLKASKIRLFTETCEKLVLVNKQMVQKLQCYLSRELFD